MATENKYTDTTYSGGGFAPGRMNGPVERVYTGTFEVAAADDNGSVYGLFRLPAELVLTELEVWNDAITLGTDYDIGLYLVGGQTTGPGAVITKDVFLNGGDMSSARASAPLDGLSALAIEYRGIRKIYEHAGHTMATKKPEYALCVTANTVGSAAGTITVHARGFIG